MCGIFGIVSSNSSRMGSKDFSRLIELLSSYAESRGSEASGLAAAQGSELAVFKKSVPFRKMRSMQDYARFLEWSFSIDSMKSGFACIGHSRLVTNGSQGLDSNNQPVITSESVGIHNGIIVNAKNLWEKHPLFTKESDLDTEVMFKIVDLNVTSGLSLVDSIGQMYKKIQGEANIAYIPRNFDSIVLASNVGSLYWFFAEKSRVLLFASEKHFLRKIQYCSARFKDEDIKIKQVAPLNGIVINYKTLNINEFNIKSEFNRSSEIAKKHNKKIFEFSGGLPKLKKCTSCVLPETFPFINFDEKGVCNFCKEGPPVKKENRASLEVLLAEIRSKNGSPDCIVALSGGRDSCYGLHVIKKELGLNPIAYTYDWAMVTDEARRNCSKICQVLGVEHIIRSADILDKRSNIRLNIQAWLKRPQLGMIPLFMAGDKQFFHYASQVSKQTNIRLVIFCGGNNLEITRFKTGFCGIQDKSVNTMVSLDLIGKIKLLKYYSINYLLNPSYINKSLIDTLFAFYSTYINRQEFLYLYKYLDWNEGEISKTLSELYGWESSGDSTSTWRIGDGTASFYNYIYHTVAGFSEHDTFRSNQIREGLITREVALKLLQEENKPRFESMKEYAALVGFSFDEALTIINNIPKLY
jgi:asparagine synthetase B (glutamine-hydrolysing)